MKRFFQYGAAFCVALGGLVIAADARTQDALDYAQAQGLCDDRGGLASAEWFDTTDDSGNPVVGLRFDCNSAGALSGNAGAIAAGAGVFLLFLGMSGGGDGGSSSDAPGSGPSGTTN